MAGLLAIAWSRIRNVTSGRLLGRVSSGTGRAEELTPAQVRSLCSVYSTSEVDAIAAAKLSLSGGTLTGHLLFTDNTYDIGASGATRPRTVHAGTSVLSPLFNNQNAAATTLGNSTYGVTVPGVIAAGGNITQPSLATISTPLSSLRVGDSYSQWIANDVLTLTANGQSIVLGGSGAYMYYRSNVTHQFLNAGATAPQAISAGAAAFSGDISMQKATQGYINAYSPNGSKYLSMWATNADDAYMQSNTAAMYLQSSSSAINLGTDLWLQTPANGSAYVFRSGVNSTFDVYNSGSPSYKYTRLTHDSTNGILSTSSGDLRHSAATGAVVCYTPSVASVMYVYAGNGSSCATMQHNGTLGIMAVSHGIMRLQTDQATYGFEFRPKSGYIEHYTPGANGNYTIWDSTGSKYLGATYDGTNGILSTSSGNLNLVPTGGTVAVTGAVTVSGALNFPPITKAALLALTPTAATAGRWRVTDATPASREAYPDGTNWRYTSDDTIVV